MPTQCGTHLDTPYTTDMCNDDEFQVGENQLSFDPAYTFKYRETCNFKSESTLQMQCVGNFNRR